MRCSAFVVSIFVAISSAMANPQDYGRVVSFGDSLSDNGNLTNLPILPAPPGSGGINVAPPFPYYFGRFSNGPTWVEILAGKGGPAGQSSQQQFWVSYAAGVPLNGGSVNVALGGARADNLGFPYGVPTQISAYEQYSALSNQTAFKPNDLVTLLAGANDIFQQFAGASAGGSSALQALGVNTALSVGADINQLIAGGAKTILLSNLPDIGRTPQFLGLGPQASLGGSLVTFAFNQALNQQAQGAAFANPNVNIIQMDLYALNKVIAANPGAFGFTNVTNACVNSAACVAANGAGYEFWDGVHPTEQAHILIARYASLLLSTDDTGKGVASLGQFALSNRLDSSDILFRRGGAVAAQRPGGLYAEVIGSTASFDGWNSYVYNSTSYDFSLGGVRGGFDANAYGMSFGAALSYQAGNLSSGVLRSDLRTTQFDAYALKRFANLFAGVESGVALNEYSSMKRFTGFPTVNADGSTHSVDYSVAGTIGAQYQLGSITLTPAVRAGYASVTIDGFTETAPILALQYGDRDITTGFWTARLRASRPLFGFPLATAYGEVGYEGLFGTSDGYSAKLAFNTAHAVAINPSELDARGLFLKAGLSGQLTESVKISGEYGLSLQDGNGEIHSGRVRLTIPLGSDLPLGE